MNMQDEVIRILTFYHGDTNFNLNPHVPEEIEHYARAALDIPDDDYVIATVRLSFTKFHRGFVICRNGLYWRNGPKVETNTNYLTWKELSERKSKFRPLPRSVNLGDGAALDNTGSINKTTSVINILDLLIDKYDEQIIENEGFVFDETGSIELTRSIPNNKAQLKTDNTESSAEANDGTSFIVSFFKKLLKK